ncbi:MAG TPA: molybdopterin-synthase adenylyltransferase MoeB [Steroidobacteraceae bacterium]|jgi:adenylyltransferase/sulfurtransferase|nr:molybdopterin-synthase adenylyltransferase MoeB [Steroidobacteraceae bacterium]
MNNSASEPTSAILGSPGTLSADERQRYARHLSLTEIGEAGQAQLRAARVLVVGAGGLGCPAALYLAAAGVGTIGLVDFDRVEESNLQRQVLFTSEDIGELKALRACTRLAALNPQVQLIAHPVELCAANVREIFAPYDLIVDGSDRIGTRYLVNDACVLFGKPLISAAIHRFEGQAMSYVPGRGPCYRCLFPEIAEGTLPSCAQAGVLGVLPGVLGSLQATEAIKLLLGIGTPLLGRVLVYDALSMRFDEFRIARRAECAVCGDHPSIHAPQDPPGFCTIEEQRRVPRILPTELARSLAREPAGVRLIDVREPDEFARGHLPGAINVPLPRIEQQGFALPAEGSASVERAAERLVFICRSGARSLRACALARRGTGREVLQLEGGLLAWREAVDPTLAL